MNILILTEDAKGREPIRIIARKVLPSSIGIKVDFANKGDLLLPDKTRAKILPYLNQGYSKIIICVDTECTKVTEADIKKAEKGLFNQISISSIKYCAVVHALESWLASDKDIIKEWLKRDFSLPQTECTPKNFLKNEFKKAGKEYDYIRDNTRLAEKVDIGRISKANASFKKFIQALKDP